MTRPTIASLTAERDQARSDAERMSRVRDNASKTAKQVSEENDHLRAIIAADKETIARLEGYVTAMSELTPPRMVEAPRELPAIIGVRPELYKSRLRGSVRFVSHGTEQYGAIHIE